MSHIPEQDDWENALSVAALHDSLKDSETKRLALGKVKTKLRALVLLDY